MAVDYRSFNCLPEHQGPAFRTWSRILQSATMSSSTSPTSPLLSPNSYSNLESSFPKLIPAENFIPFETNKSDEKANRSNFETHLNSNNQERMLDEGQNGLTANGEHSSDVSILTYAPWKRKSYPENAYGCVKFCFVY